VVLPALCAFACAPAPYASAQVKTAPAAVNSSCSRDSALTTVRQQAEASKQIDDQVKRSAVLIRSADLLWAHQQEAARGVFSEAFELAAANFREKGDEPRRDGLALLVETPDQRYVVINAIARRDNAWAKKLTGQMLEQDRREAEGLEAVLAAADKIADSNVSRQVLNWVYFGRAQGALKERRFDDTKEMASRVEELDQRAYLYATIAKELLGKAETRDRAREPLDELLVFAGKAPDTVVKARTLLAGAYLFAKLDPARSLSVLNEAIASVNRIESPDFSRQSLVRRIELKNFARYATFQTPEFSPEAVFGELGKNDFDLAVAQANNIADRSLRSNILLAASEACLRDAAQKQKGENTKKKATAEPDGRRDPDDGKTGSAGRHPAVPTPSAVVAAASGRSPTVGGG
jgi:hypothetical protein